MVTPVGILLPRYDALTVYAVTSKVTSDCLCDILCQWWQANKERFPKVKTLLLNLDNGPECHSRRTQFLARLIEFVSETRVGLQLAYYPPYHSKYNPIERCWGVLENHWNGDLMDSVETVVKFTRSMTWKGKHPDVELVTTSYSTGVRLTQKAMAALETQVQRVKGLHKWFLSITTETIANGRVIPS